MFAIAGAMYYADFCNIFIWHPIIALCFFTIKIIYDLDNIKVIYTLKMKHIIMYVILFYLNYTGMVAVSSNDR